MINPPPSLSPGEIDLWSAQITTWRDHFISAPRVLAAGEIEKLERLKSAEKKDQYLVSSSLTRIILAAYAKLPSHLLRIARGEDGKPFLVSREFEFNLAHSGDQYLLAVAGKGQACGVDIQQEYPIQKSSRLLGNIFHPAELEYLEEKKAKGAFLMSAFSIWTAKEAYLKASGTGIQEYPNWLCMLPDPSTRGAFHASSTQQGHGSGIWTIQSLEAPAGYQAAIAAKGTITKVKRLDIKPGDLGVEDLSSSYPAQAGSVPG